MTEQIQETELLKKKKEAALGEFAGMKRKFEGEFAKFAALLKNFMVVENGQLKVQEKTAHVAAEALGNGGEKVVCSVVDGKFVLEFQREKAEGEKAEIVAE